MTTRNSPIDLRLFAAVLCLGAVLSFTPRVVGQTVWTGFDFSFSKADSADHTLPQNQDRISDNVWLTRRVQEGLFNIRLEEFYDRVGDTSPADTLWATSLNNPGKTISAANWAALDFTNWVFAYGGPGAGFIGNITNINAVVHLVSDDVYLDIQFTQWAQGCCGAFAYNRAEGTLPPPILGDHNSDGIVDAADYVLWRKEPAAHGGDPQGYLDWRANFGNVASGSSTPSAVPEPAAGALLLVALLTLRLTTTRRTRRPQLL